MITQLAPLLRITCSFLICLLATVSHSQNDTISIPSLYEYIVSVDQNILKSDGDSLIHKLKYENEQHGNMNDSLVVLAMLHYYKSIQIDLSLEERFHILQSSQKTFTNLSSVSIQDQVDLLNQFVIYYRQSSQIDSIKSALQKMRILLDQISEPTEFEINLAYENARYTYLQNDFLASLTFLQNGLSYLEEYFPERVRMKMNFLNGIGIGYRRTNQPQLAIEHHHRTLEFLHAHTPGSYWEGNVLNNLGLCHSDLGQYDQAIYYMKEAINSYMKLGNEYQDQIATGYDNIAVVFQQKGQVDSALYYSNHALDLMRQNFGPDYPDQLLPLSTITETYYRHQQLAQADSVSQISIHFLRTLGWTSSDPDGDYYLFDALSLLATSVEIKHAIYMKEPSVKLLTDAVKLDIAYMNTIDYAYDGIENSQSREIFQEKSKRIFSIAIEDVFELYQVTRQDSLLDIALTYIEKYKSIELLQASQKDKINHDPTFKRLNQEQTILIDSIYLLEKSLATSNPEGSTNQTELNRARENLYQWQRRVKENYPKYYDLIHHPDPLTINLVQERILTPEKTILSYHVADSFLFILAINKSEVRFEKISCDQELSLMIEELRDAVFGYFLSKEKSDELYTVKTEQFIESSLALYGLLISPVKQFLKKKVLVIPDKSLGYLPFDMLLATKPENIFHFKTHEYFLRHHAVSYCYSVYLAQEMEQKPHPTNQQILAVAPSYTPSKNDENLFALRSSLGPLKYNTSEVRSVLDIRPGVSLVGAHATKAQFLEQHKNYGMIHLATHGKANDGEGDFSYLAFTNHSDLDFKLYANEIYSLDLQCELVTLSACESGLGELKSGEGIISLARAFSFAGAKSIVSTLWSVNDHSTVDLMSSFYKNLARSKTKDVALQQAKISYLQKADHSAAHPFFWSAFIAVGDMTSIPGSHKWLNIFGISIVCVLLVIFGWYTIKK